MWKQGKQKYRSDYILKHVNNLKKSKILEIGAFASPIFRKDDFDVTFFDRRSTNELKDSVSNMVKRNAIVNVDYHSKENDFSKVFSNKFDLIIANHVVEHVPDLITWLKNIGNITQDDGLLFMAVPDKNFTFDKLRSPSILREIIDNYLNNSQKPTLAQISDYLYYKRPIKKGKEVWSGNYKKNLEVSKFKSFGEALSEANRLSNSKEYVDCHCNVFTHKSFCNIINQLFESDLIKFKVKFSQDVIMPFNEFLVILQKKVD